MIEETHRHDMTNTNIDAPWTVAWSKHSRPDSLRQQLAELQSAATFFQQGEPALDKLYPGRREKVSRRANRLLEGDLF